MKRPDVYSAMWAMAPCCLYQGNPSAGRGGQPSPLEAIKPVEQARKGDRGILVGFASAAAWSPNPDNPPFFLDLPTKNGAVVPEVAARYGANSPLALVFQYAANLSKYKAVVIDGEKGRQPLSPLVALKDGFVDRVLGAQLTTGVPRRELRRIRAVSLQHNRQLGWPTDFGELLKPRISWIPREWYVVSLTT